MESEFVTLVDTSKEVERLRDLLYKMHFGPKNISLISILCDSQITLAKIYNEVYNAKSKYIDLRQDYIMKLIKSGKIFLNYFMFSNARRLDI